MGSLREQRVREFIVFEGQWIRWTGLAHKISGQ